MWWIQNSEIPCNVYRTFFQKILKSELQQTQCSMPPDKRFNYSPLPYIHFAYCTHDSFILITFVKMLWQSFGRQSYSLEDVFCTCHRCLISCSQSQRIVTTCTLFPFITNDDSSSVQSLSVQASSHQHGI